MIYGIRCCAWAVKADADAIYERGRWMPLCCVDFASSNLAAAPAASAIYAKQVCVNKPLASLQIAWDKYDCYCSDLTQGTRRNLTCGLSESFKTV